MGDIANYDHFQHRINKFARGNAGQEGEDQAAHARDVSISNLTWRNNKYVIPVRFLYYLFEVTLTMGVSRSLKFDLETNNQKFLNL